MCDENHMYNSNIKATNNKTKAQIAQRSYSFVVNTIHWWKLALENSNVLKHWRKIVSNESYLKKSSINSEKFYVIKLLRAVGGCLGIERRRRTRKPAISSGESEKAVTRRFPNGGIQWDETLTILNWIHRLRKRHLPKWHISVGRGKEIYKRFP